MTNNWLLSKLRRIEKSIATIDVPTTCNATFHGDLRTISPTAKTRELENLIHELKNCQKLVTTDSEQEWLNSVKETLSARIDLVFNTPLIQYEG